MIKTLKITLLALFLTGSSALFAQDKPKCNDYQKGKFVIKNAGAEPDHYIKRTKKYQIETIEGGKEVIKMKIIWLNDCTYQLEFHSAKNFNYQLPEGTIITGKITGTTNDYCDLEVGANIEGFIPMKLKMHKQ